MLKKAKVLIIEDEGDLNTVCQNFQTVNWVDVSNNTGWAIFRALTDVATI